MTSRLPLTPAQRSRRKQDLLLVSSLARGQAMVAIDQIGHRADRLVGAYHQLRAWLSTPKMGTLASVAASVAGLLALRRVRSQSQSTTSRRRRFSTASGGRTPQGGGLGGAVRLLRWGVLSWRVWKLAAGLLPGLRAPR